VRGWNKGVLMRWSVAALMVLACLYPKFARAAHDGEYGGIATRTADRWGKCELSVKMRVDIQGNTLTGHTPAQSSQYALTWNGDSFTGQGRGLLSGKVNGDLLSYDFMGMGCSYHLELHRTS